MFLMSVNGMGNVQFYHQEAIDFKSPDNWFTDVVMHMEPEFAQKRLDTVLSKCASGMFK